MPIININLPVAKKIYTVSELNCQSKKLLEANFSNIQIEGEISNLSKPSSGHFYFKLKDNQAQIQCAFFRNRAMRLPFNLEEGIHIIATANVSMYAARGDYQLIVEHVELAGEGKLRLKFEALKQKLQSMGLFALEHKKNLPTLPKAIGIITSPTGAALQDALTTLKRRCPAIPIFIYPTQVQGEQAAAQIAKQIQLANATKHCDVLLLIRGGGSLEDLWPFNEECVAHAIYKSQLPIISGVGHETDITLADFCADHRAATPTAAATIVCPNQEELLIHIQLQKSLLLKYINQILNRYRLFALHLTQRLRNPRQLLDQKRLHVNAIRIRLSQCLQNQLHQGKNTLYALHQRLNRLNPSYGLQKQQLEIVSFQHRLTQVINKQLISHQQQFKTLGTKLHMASPLATLERGYSLALKENNQLISSIYQVKEQENFWLQLKDGKLHATVLKN